MKRLRKISKVPFVIGGLYQRPIDRFSGQHPAFHRRVASFNFGEIERARVAANQQPAGKMHFGQRVDTPFGDGARAVGETFSAAEGFAKGRVMLHTLKLIERA